jgi:hypothetical protein
MWGVILATFLITLHVPPGLLAVASVLCYEGWLFKPTKTYITLALVGVISIVTFCILLPDNLFAETLVRRLTNFSLSRLIKFLSFSGFTLATLLYLIRKDITKSFLRNYSIVLIGALAMGAYYYLLMLFLTPLLILTERPITKNNLRWILAPILFNILANVIHPMYASIENTEYCKQVNTIIETTAQLEKELLIQESTPKLFIENNIAPASFNQGNNCRMLLFEPNRMLVFDSISQGDKIAITTTNKLKQFLHHQDYQTSIYYEVDDVLDPVKGKLSILSLYRKRTDSLGLWILTAKKI